MLSTNLLSRVSQIGGMFVCVCRVISRLLVFLHFFKPTSQLTKIYEFLLESLAINLITMGNVLLTYFVGFSLFTAGDYFEGETLSDTA